MSLHGAMKTCLVLTLRWPCIISISNQMLNWLSSNNDDFTLILWRPSKLKFTNSSNVASFERNNTQTGLLILCLYSRRTGRSGFASTSVILTPLVLRMKFHFPSLTSWLTTHIASKECPSWMAFSGYNHIKMYLGWLKAYIISNTGGVYY